MFGVEAASRVGINGGEKFQEQAREPLGCYSKQTGSTTHLNAFLWWGTKKIVPNCRPASIVHGEEDYAFNSFIIKAVTV